MNRADTKDGGRQPTLQSRPHIGEFHKEFMAAVAFFEVFGYLSLPITVQGSTDIRLEPVNNPATTLVGFVSEMAFDETLTERQAALCNESWYVARRNAQYRGDLFGCLVFDIVVPKGNLMPYRQLFIGNGCARQQVRRLLAKYLGNALVATRYPMPIRGPAYGMEQRGAQRQLQGARQQLCVQPREGLGEDTCGKRWRAHERRSQPLAGSAMPAAENREGPLVAGADAFDQLLVTAAMAVEHPVDPPFATDAEQMLAHASRPRRVSIDCLMTKM